MKTKKIRTTIVHTITLTLIFTLGMATAAAQQKYQIAGEQIMAFTKQERSMVGDVDGHMLSLSEAEGVNLSTGKTEFMNGAQLKSMVASDLVNYNGPIQGYTISKKGNDSFYAKFEGKITTAISSDGTPLSTIEGTMIWINGTGKYENIRGNGAYKGRYIASNIYKIDWEGEYWIEN